MTGERTRRSWTEVAVFENVEDADALVEFLRQRRFDNRAYNDKVLRYFLFLRPPRITYRVQVRESEFKVVTNILEKERPAILEKAFRCPTCGSLRINYPQMTRKFFLPTVVLHLGIIFRFIQHEAYCEHCHHIWNLPKDGVTLVPESRPAKPFFPF